MVDENLPPALARALDALFNGKHNVVHLRARFGSNVKDLEWIPLLSAEGRWIVISGDRRITRNRAEYEAFRSSNLVGFFLSRGLQKAKVTKQMERLLALWETMETQEQLVQGGAMFELPMTSTRLRQL
ncbi:MAG: PIN-like domain-containing protein [Bauldia sp.]